MKKLKWDRVNKENLDISHKNQILNKLYRDAELVSKPSYTLSKVASPKNNITYPPEGSKIYPYVSSCKIDFKSVIAIKRPPHKSETESLINQLILSMISSKYEELIGIGSNQTLPSSRIISVNCKLKEVIRSVIDKYRYGIMNGIDQLTSGRFQVSLEIIFDIKLSKQDTEFLYREKDYHPHIGGTGFSLLTNNILKEILDMATKRLGIDLDNLSE